MTAGERLLAAAAARLSDRALERAFGHLPGQAAIFSEMAKSFVPRVANGFTGELQYELRRSSGRVRRWTMRVSSHDARAKLGRADAPTLVLQLTVADFLRLAAGQTDPVELLKGHRLQVSGDGLLAARLGSMFGRPAPPDIYVAPRTV